MYVKFSKFQRVKKKKFEKKTTACSGQQPLNTVYNEINTWKNVILLINLTLKKSRQICQARRCACVQCSNAHSPAGAWDPDHCRELTHSTSLLFLPLHSGRTKLPVVHVLFVTESSPAAPIKRISSVVIPQYNLLSWISTVLFKLVLLNEHLVLFQYKFLNWHTNYNFFSFWNWLQYSFLVKSKIMFNPLLFLSSSWHKVKSILTINSLTLTKL